MLSGVLAPVNARLREVGDPQAMSQRRSVNYSLFWLIVLGCEPHPPH